MSIDQCIIWGTPLLVDQVNFLDVNRYTSLKALITDSPPCVLSLADDSNTYTVYNPRAGGKYKAHHQQMLAKIGILDTGMVRELEIEEKIRLSGYIAKENLKDNIPSIDSIMRDKNWLEHLPPAPNKYNIKEKTNLLLMGLTKLYPDIGEGISININQSVYESKSFEWFLYALSYCATEDEFKFLINSLNKSKDIEVVGDYAGGDRVIQLTDTGLNRASSLEHKTLNKNSKKAFIAMWLDPSMDDLKQNVTKAIKNAGYKPLRIDDKKHSNKIDDEILSEIENSQFIVCDLTSSAEDKPRASVYFEAGYAKGKGIPVIWTCSEKMKKAQANSFDTRQYKCLFWNKNNMETFVTELQEHIKKIN